MLLTITLAGVTRDFHVGAEDIDNNDWNDIINDMLDSVEKSGKF